jgi:hypothetical protein
MSSPDQSGISSGATHIMRQDLDGRAEKPASGEPRAGLASPLRAAAGLLGHEGWATLPLRLPRPRSQVALAAGHARECSCPILRGQYGGLAHAPPSAQGNLLRCLAECCAPISEAPVRGWMRGTRRGSRQRRWILGWREPKERGGGRPTFLPGFETYDIEIAGACPVTGRETRQGVGMGCIGTGC